MGGAAFAAVIGPLLGTILSSVFAPDPPSLPAPVALPPTPTPAAPQEVVPEAPKVSTAADVTEEPVVDVEAAKARATKRRRNVRQERNLFSLSQDDSETVILTKSLLSGG